MINVNPTKFSTLKMSTLSENLQKAEVKAKNRLSFLKSGIEYTRYKWDSPLICVSANGNKLIVCETDHEDFEGYAALALAMNDPKILFNQEFESLRSAIEYMLKKQIKIICVL